MTRKENTTKRKYFTNTASRLPDHNLYCLNEEFYSSNHDLHSQNSNLRSQNHDLRLQKSNLRSSNSNLHSQNSRGDEPTVFLGTRNGDTRRGSNMTPAVARENKACLIGAQCERALSALLAPPVPPPSPAGQHLETVRHGARSRVL